jgi:phospholipase/carboxylesterase
MSTLNPIPPQTIDRWRVAQRSAVNPEVLAAAGGAGKAPVVVLLHGRGSNEEDLQGLHPFLGPSVTLITPGAPFPAAPWGYGSGWAWYHYINEDRMVPETLDASLAALDGFFDGLPARLGTSAASMGPLLLGGFSQGGTTALAWALTRPGRVAGVLNLSGFLAAVPVVDDALHAGHGQGLSVFWGHGEHDPAIPFFLGLRGREALERHGAQLTRFDHPGGHTITPGEAQAIQSWITAHGT